MKGKSQGVAFEVQEYNFSETQEGSSDKFKSISDLYAAYGQDNNVSSEKTLKLYSKVRKFFEEVSLVIVKDHARNTLNSVVATQNRVVEMRLNL